jgi:ABC-type glycerol-3-phosphate transport system substrate-binding protein
VRLIVALLSAALVAAGCAGGDDGPTGASDELATISSVQQIARAFNQDSGHPRLVLLLSPT